jgi:hypothetical protein
MSNLMSASARNCDPSMSASAVENCDLCWKCQSLLNTQFAEGLVITEDNATQQEPDKKQIRRIKTVDSVEVTASNGCTLCLHLLHALGNPAKAALHKLTSAIEGTSLPDIVYEQEVFLSEGHPPSIALHVDPDNSLGWNSGNELKCLLQLFPEAGKS